MRAAVRAQNAILDGELVCLDDTGRPVFRPLPFRRAACYFYAFDMLACDGEDLRHKPLVERKRRLRRVLRRSHRVRYLDHIIGRGRDLYALACADDLEGIVAKLARGTYTDDRRVSTWWKVKNPAYSQAVGRWEWFDRRRGSSARL